MRLLIISSIDSEAIDRLRQTHDVIYEMNPDKEKLIDFISDRDILILRSGVQISEDVIAKAPELKLIIRAGCGLDNIDVKAAQRRGLELVTIPQPASFAVAEMTFGLMLTLARRILEADASRREGKWIKTQLKGRLLTGKTLGIVGVGNIGSRVAHLGLAWGMKIIGCVEHPSMERAKTFFEKGVELTDLYNVLSNADFVSLHVPKKESTLKLIDAEALSHMKKDSYLVNIARGGVVDEKALYHELTEGDHLLGAALDVHEHEGDGIISPFSELKNVVLTPHIGSMTHDTYKDIGNRIFKIVDGFVKDKYEVRQREMVA